MPRGAVVKQEENTEGDLLFK